MSSNKLEERILLFKASITNIFSSVILAMKMAHKVISASDVGFAVTHLNSSLFNP